MKNPKQNVTPESQNDLVTVNINQDIVSSLELVKQINLFRQKEGKPLLEHKILLRTIREEFQEEINEYKIVLVNYTDSKGEKRPMFNLTFNQAKQILFRESKLVRKSIIQYLDIVTLLDLTVGIIQLKV